MLPFWGSCSWRRWRPPVCPQLPLPLLAGRDTPRPGHAAQSACVRRRGCKAARGVRNWEMRQPSAQGRRALSPPARAVCADAVCGHSRCLRAVSAAPAFLLGAGAAQDKDESTLAKAYFRWSAEGWNATTKDGEDWPSSGELGYLKSSDDDDTLWYYTASPDFLGELCCALWRPRYHWCGPDGASAPLLRPCPSVSISSSACGEPAESAAPQLQATR